MANYVWMPNANYDIMCRKTVLIPKNDKDKDNILVFGNTLTYNSDIFSGTSVTMTHRPFKFFHNFANWLRSLLLKHYIWLWQDHHYGSRF